MKWGNIVAMADRQSQALPRSFRSPRLVPFLQLRDNGLECFRNSGLDVIGNLPASWMADYGPKSTPPQESSFPGDERRRLQSWRWR